MRVCCDLVFSLKLLSFLFIVWIGRLVFTNLYKGKGKGEGKRRGNVPKPYLLKKGMVIDSWRGVCEYSGISVLFDTSFPAFTDVSVSFLVIFPLHKKKHTNMGERERRC